MTDEREPKLQFFAYSHLPEHLQPISKTFHEVAKWMVDHLPRNPMRTLALHSLLRAKDDAIRAKMYKE
jgi:hypothetical protein